MPVASTPQVDLPQEPGNPVRSRLALDRPSAPPRPFPEVGEAEEVEAPRLFGLHSSRPRRRTGPFETHQTGLVGVEAPAVLAESIRQHLQHPPSLAFQLKDQHESSSAGESHPRALPEPDVRLSPHPAPTIQPPA